MLVHHHEKYIEIHGYDKIVIMEQSEHKLLHTRLRNEGKCNIPSNELRKIATKAHRRTYNSKSNRTEYRKKNIQHINFYEALVPNVRFTEVLEYNHKTGNVGLAAFFQAIHSKELYYIDIEETP